MAEILTVRGRNGGKVTSLYAKLQKARVKFHAQRIEYEEKFLLEHGINPQRPGSAWKFDELIRKK